jgi:hypothetical protein
MKLAAIAFFAGLVMAMSDGPWFPWANLAGVIIFSIAPVAAWRADRKAHRRITSEAIHRR